MEFLPKTLGTRPRLAIEVRAEGVVAARAEDAAAILTAVSRADLAEGAVAPGLKAGNVADRAGVAGAIRSALEGVAGRGMDRSRDVTLVVPDAAVRVLLLDFDSLPSKETEAMPVVRFRLKKLVPFDVDTAAVSYQVMSSSKDAVRVLAIAMPKDVLDEYEAAVTAAGYQPGAVLSSTLAALAGLDESEAPVLVVNASEGSVTTAIVQAGILLLHRSVDMGGEAEVESRAAVHAGGESDPFEAEAAMQTGVVQSETAHESATREVVQAVSVAAAYFEDTLQTTPDTLLSAGTLGAEMLAALMQENGMEGLRVRETVDAGVIETGAVTAAVPRGWLAGVRGALRN
ncbi:hypothetical protein GCM10011507_17140 [Edaphobacter acidisoli]|uniref:Type IV pilus assembly protein PilM n=1 Tax=Edaphobacter acidisoli TaxID=2040573 RepID=A0A916RQY9_9BACT|nr:hypothetical protein [Edaphobacter acidisoli]GGA66131.1 hypothetical protein GCM10011507_17140 [Edaphobacter acidisoli]